jgi:hypothetical protein
MSFIRRIINMEAALFYFMKKYHYYLNLIYSCFSFLNSHFMFKLAMIKSYF